MAEPSKTETMEGDIERLLFRSRRHMPADAASLSPNVAIQRRSVLPSEKPSFQSSHFFVLLWDGHVAEGETLDGLGQYRAYRKYPYTLSTCPPGIRGPIRNNARHDMIVAALGADFLKTIAEQSSRPLDLESVRPLHGADDASARGLLQLLLREVEAFSPTGLLYTDSLATALAMRLLPAYAQEPKTAHGAIAALPKHLLRRVLDRLEAALEDHVDLTTLASETGYSSGHFLKMFHASTGLTPHRYLLERRLQRARELIDARRLSIAQVAQACGFSSHAHLSTAFRKKFGLAPSAYRRFV
jgi:AraC family transcriptional regulator